MAQVEVITGPERRRRWSENQKRAIVAASFAPGAVVCDVARRAEVSPGQIYRWRQELRAAGCGRSPRDKGPLWSIRQAIGCSYLSGLWWMPVFPMFRAGETNASTAVHKKLTANGACR